MSGEHMSGILFKKAGKIMEMMIMFFPDTENYGT